MQYEFVSYRLYDIFNLWQDLLIVIGELKIYQLVIRATKY